MHLSVVIPVWQESRRVGRMVEGVRALRRALPYPIEVIVVDDGSTDGTADAVQRAGIEIIRQPHRGKGAAVRTGMLASTGTYRLLADADWSMAPEQVQLLLPPALTDFDIAIASRQAHGATREGEPLWRHVVGRAYNALVQWFVLPGIEDTQCGFKCFRGEVAEALYRRSREDGWAADVEVLALARALGLRVAEVPIDWIYDSDSRVSVLGDAPEMAAALLRIRTRLQARAYPPLERGYVVVQPDQDQHPS